MAVLTAAQWKTKESPEFPIDLGGGLEVWVKKPDLQLLILNNMMATPLFASVVKMIGDWIGKPLDKLTDDDLSKSADMVMFVNLYTCAACINPRVVMTIEEKAANPEAMWVMDITLGTKRTIMTEIITHSEAATSAVVAAATTFPEGGPIEGIGSDVPEVQAAAV